MVVQDKRQAEDQRQESTFDSWQPKTALGSKLYPAPMQEATGLASTKQKETCAE